MFRLGRPRVGFADILVIVENDNGALDNRQKIGTNGASAAKKRRETHKKKGQDDKTTRRQDGKTRRRLNWVE